MSVWDTYSARADVRGRTKRETVLSRERRNLAIKLPDSLSYHAVDIDGVEQNVAIIDSDNLNEKNIFSMPGEDLALGGIVTWMNTHWILTERDFNTELRVKGKLLQCNYLLRWIDKDDLTIHEQWCVIEDGTKYLTGDYEDRDFFVTRGDARVAMTISRNEYTVKFDRTSRFIMDDPLSTEPLAFLLTKPFKVGHCYTTDGEDRGYFSFVLSECNTEDDDNKELRVADYYKYFPKDDGGTDAPDTGSDVGGKKAWI